MDFNALPRRGEIMHSTAPPACPALQPRPANPSSSRTAVTPPARGPAQLPLASQLRRAREQEREHLARELHDVLGGLLTAARLDVAGLQSRLAGQDPEIDRRLDHLNETLLGAFALKRRIIDGLAPASLHGAGLAASIETMVREFVEGSGIRLSTYLDKVATDEPTQLAIYRLVQESLTNMAKYSGADAAEILLRNQGNVITVVVRDNGRGFDPTQTQTHCHGLEGMRQRIESVGGQLTVESSPGRGTCIRATLPRLAHPAARAQ
jgi:signal transduction histidine kinase